jgi:hypothetical protein
MRLAVLPVCLAALPLSAQWDVRLELPRPSGQSLPQTMLSGGRQLVAGEFNTGKGFIASANRRVFQIGPLFKLEAGMEYAQLTADSTFTLDGTTHDTRLKQQGVGVGLNAQLWVPFTGLAGEIGVIQRLQHYTFDTAGAASTKDLSRTWLRVGARWRVPAMVIHPYVVASYQQPITKDHPVKLSSSSDLAAYFSAQGSGQEFERLWTFGVGVAF